MFSWLQLYRKVLIGRVWSAVAVADAVPASVTAAVVTATHRPTAVQPLRVFTQPSRVMVAEMPEHVRLPGMSGILICPVRVHQGFLSRIVTAGKAPPVRRAWITLLAAKP
ncbi:MAG: hypothetical protein LBV60_25615 [Streptomyces sp.]|nr:hypothetical protein [Streptomyces sp.]